jgi:molybdopterin-guanine dinucleotide biosynthesis protein A
MGSFKLLILAGGQSSRMGSPKHLLPVPSTGQPLYKHLINVMYRAFPETQTIYFSVAENSTLDDTLQQEELLLPTRSGNTRIEMKKIPDESTQSIGPAAGLLAAHHYDRNATWMIVACDYPLLDLAALHQLKEAYEDPITCFVNKDGFSEPLLAIWSSQALQSLVDNVESGRSGPNYTVKHLKGKLIRPTEDDWILNTNTPEEWEVAKSRIKKDQSIAGA